jgi:RHS repeat-associated protein
MTKSGVTYYLTYDQVGSLRIVADASSNVVKRIDYDSFGNIIEDTDPAFEAPFGFAGGLYDQDTGFVRFGYRDYYPDTGRWTAKDPILFAGGDTDLFGYCLNNPVNALDPLGLIVLYGGGGFSGGVGGKPNPDDGDGPNFFSGTGGFYMGHTEKGGGEMGWTISGEAGRIVGVAVPAGGLYFGVNFGNVEDFRGEGATAGIVLFGISFEATFDSTNKWSGFNIGIGRRGIAFGAFGTETHTMLIPTDSSSPCK